jgi:hypothetical protein
MKKIIPIIFTLIALTAFAEETDYFPDGTINAFCEEWYGKHLSTMKEPSLFPIASDQSKEIYRFTLLRTWGRPISVRVDVNENVITIHTVKLTGSGGYEPGGIKFKESITLSPEASSKLIKKINSLKFFSMPLEDDTRGCDGSEWIFEGIKNGQYHVISRWCPDDYDTEKRNLVEFVAVCNCLLKYVKKNTDKKPERSSRSLKPNVTNVVRGASTTQTTTYTRSTNYVCKITQIDKDSDGTWDFSSQTVTVSSNIVFRLMINPYRRTLKIPPTPDMHIFMVQNKTNDSVEQIVIRSSDNTFSDVLNISTNGFYIPSSKEQLQNNLHNP